MAEEFQESDIVFPDQDCRNYSGRDDCDGGSLEDFMEMFLNDQPPNNYWPARNNDENIATLGKSKAKKIKTTVSSIPVNIPEGILRCSAEYGVGEYEDGWDDGEMVPPHVILGRRVAGKMAFSVCTGNGRTLKGRDLRQVRNSILRLTGFLES